MRARTLSIVGVAALAVALANCAGSLPGVEPDKPPVPKIDMSGRWLLMAPNSPSCGMTFGAGAEGGTIKPEGGCPGEFFTSRHWALEGDQLVIRNHNDEPLAQLRFAGGRFEGKSTAGLQITLARSILPSN